MNKVVLYEGWQMSCCGTDFFIGDHIEWTVSDSSNIQNLHGVGTIDYLEDHHEGLDRSGKTNVLTGQVKSIFLLYARYEEESDILVPKEWIKIETKSSKPQKNEVVNKPENFELSGYLVEISDVDIQPSVSTS